MHKYSCYTISTGEIMENEKLPPILKALRDTTEYDIKIPHGNRVRTMILEYGECGIYHGNNKIYQITVKRW